MKSKCFIIQINLLEEERERERRATTDHSSLPSSSDLIYFYRKEDKKVDLKTD